MKSLFCIVLIFAIFIADSLGAVSMGVFKDPKHPGKCTINDDLILSPGQEVKDPNADCGRIICGNNGVAEFQTCGVQKIHGCTLGDYVNKNLPYPECCKRHKICN